MKKFAYQKTVDHFNETEEYKTRKGIVHTEEDPIMIDFIVRNAERNDKILEVGGGSGAFLDLVIGDTVIKKAYNMELAYNAYKKQVNMDISLMGGNALDLPFKDKSFDWVVVKNLLHHLVGGTRNESKAFTKQAIKELIRVTKNKGHIIILDQYNRHKSFSFVIFYLTLFFSVFGVSFKSFGWGKNIIVSFLTPEETINLLTESNNVKIILRREKRINVSKKLKFTFLMSNIGRLLIIGEL